MHARARAWRHRLTIMLALAAIDLAFTAFCERIIVVDHRELDAIDADRGGLLAELFADA